MIPSIAHYTADHRHVLAVVGQAAGIVDPVAVEFDEFRQPLVKQAVRGKLIPLDGVLIRDWDPDERKTRVGARFGARLYHLDGIPFVRCEAAFHSDIYNFDFFVVPRGDYLRLYRLALRAKHTEEPHGLPPVLPEGQLETLRQNTLRYLDGANLRRIRDLGGRPKRGLLLTGPPGNGKTSACRWLLQECKQHGHDHKLVTPDAYQMARRHCNPVEAVRELFRVETRGIVFFDDMDIALRDRDTVKETDDQAVFLSALDGIEVNEGVVYVFTTNCALELIDPAFKRPGRIDLLMRFDAPEADLRRRLIERWHTDVRGSIDLKLAVRETEGFSFAEVEELKNLLILRYLETSEWDWPAAMSQFRVNRGEFAGKRAQPLGFGAVAKGANGHAMGV